MRFSGLVVTICLLIAIGHHNEAKGLELELQTLKLNCSNCISEVKNGVLLIVHSYDYEMAKEIKKLQALGYMQGSADYAAELYVPYTFSKPTITVKLVIGSLTLNDEGRQYIIFSLLDSDRRVMSKKQFLANEYNSAIKEKKPIVAELSTGTIIGRSRQGTLVFKFAGIDSVRITKLGVE